MPGLWLDHRVPPKRVNRGYAGRHGRSAEETFDFGEALGGVRVEEAAEGGVGCGDSVFGRLDDVETFAGGDDAEAAGAGGDGAAKGFEAGRRAVHGDERLRETADTRSDDIGAGFAGDGAEQADECRRDEGGIAGAGEGEPCATVGEAGGKPGEGAKAREFVGDGDDFGGGGEGRERLARGVNDEDAFDGGGHGIHDPLEEGPAAQGGRGFVAAEPRAAAAGEDDGFDAGAHGTP